MVLPLNKRFEYSRILTTPPIGYFMNHSFDKYDSEIDICKQVVQQISPVDNSPYNERKKKKEIIISAPWTCHVFTEKSFLIKPKGEHHFL